MLEVSALATLLVRLVLAYVFLNSALDKLVYGQHASRRLAVAFPLVKLAPRASTAFWASSR